MSQALLALITALFGKKAGPYAKALTPALAGIVAVAAQVIATGHFDRAALATAITTAALALLTFLVPNAKAVLGPLDVALQALVAAAQTHIGKLTAQSIDQLTGVKAHDPTPDPVPLALGPLAAGSQQAAFLPPAIAAEPQRLVAGAVSPATAVYTLTDPANPVAAGSLPADTPVRLATPA